MKKLHITIVMLTLNEECNLSGAIQNCMDWAEEIYIVDSCSTDNTVDIALEHGVKIVQRPFTNFGDQWNFALERLPIKTKWTFKLDPDERLSEELKNEIGELVNGAPSCRGYIMDRRLWFIGKPLHVLAPVLRLWRTGKCRFSDVLVNEYPVVDGPVGKLKGILEHFDSPDLHHWWDKQNRYTSMEAIMRARGDPFAAEPKLFGSTLEQRMFFKRLFFKLPFRYQLQLLYELFGRGAWRDGYVGLAWARLRVEVMRMIDLKTKEMKLTGRVPAVPKPLAGEFNPRILSSPLQRQVFSEE